jgi:hypothetical protein
MIPANAFSSLKHPSVTGKCRYTFKQEKKRAWVTYGNHE